MQSIVISVLCLVVGWRLVRDAQIAVQSGVARIFGQWPTNLVRSENPAAFWWSVALAQFVGHSALAIGVVTMVLMVLRNLGFDVG